MKYLFWMSFIDGDFSITTYDSKREVIKAHKEIEEMKNPILDGFGWCVDDDSLSVKLLKKRLEKALLLERSSI